MEFASDHNLEWFEHLSVPDVAAIVREQLSTVVFAAGGTNRWYMLNYLDDWPKDASYWPDYLKHDGERFLEILRMFFDHGVHTVFTYAMVPGQFQKGRGKDYLANALTTGMDRIAGNAEFMQFYADYGVRVRFFGDYQEVLAGSEYQATLDKFEDVHAATAHHDQHLICWGFVSHPDQTSDIVKLAVQFYEIHGRAPTRDELIPLYYGIPVKPVDLMIGFNRTRISVLMPPLLGDNADLYFTVGLSMDLSAPVFRRILYDRLFARKSRHRAYETLTPEAFAQLRAYYALNRENVLGLGERFEAGGVWHPLPQVQLPPEWEKSKA